MVLTFNQDIITKKMVLKQVPPMYNDHVQIMWECFNLDAIVNGAGFELIRLREKNVEMIVQKTLFFTRIRLRYIYKSKKIAKYEMV